MAFKVAARTVLELGAELISSDAVAIYELVKNAIDACSPDGVDVDFCVTLRHSDFVDALDRATRCVEAHSVGTMSKAQESKELSDIRGAVLTKLLGDAPADARSKFAKTLQQATSVDGLIASLRLAYETLNWIEFRDSGYGMSKSDLLEAYLVIGTPTRHKQLLTKMAAEQSTLPLGEKGVGRLSAMRLGSKLTVTTATQSDPRLNLLSVDWDAFNDLDKLVSDIHLEPVDGGPKPRRDYSGTTIRIAGLTGNWSLKRIREVSKSELSRLSDPLSETRRRFRIVVRFNRERIELPRLDQTLLDLAHAKVSGSYLVEGGQPRLEVMLSCNDLGKGNPPEQRTFRLTTIDLRSITKDDQLEIPSSALTTTGPFSFDLYWYNRRLLRGVDSIGERKRVMELQAQWSGIMLFRDGYRVFPYGADQDDWLDLDRRALASPGYKLNKAQFIGRVKISRKHNPRLIDQTNREGLKDCDEKQVLVEILRFVIQDRLKHFIEEVDQRQRTVELDFQKAEKRVSDLQTRASDTLKTLQSRHPGDRKALSELQSLLTEMRGYFEAAKLRAEQVEDERDRMIQLAGVGLMLEIIAHELARSTEHTLRLLGEADPNRLPENVAGLFDNLRDEMKSMNRRLRVLDPLSVSGRQRKETFDLVALVRDVFASHAIQFRRHSIQTEINIESKSKAIPIHGVRGMFVQIVENLLQNSLYWMDLRKQDEDDYVPKVNVTLSDPPEVLRFTDNGPGVDPTLREEIFKPFFSTKGKTRRQGLGLYIARDCASHNGGQLYLLNEFGVHPGRHNTFVLEMQSVKK